MKKCLIETLLITLLITLFNTIPVFAYTGGILDGRNVNVGSTIDNTFIVTADATDNNLETYFKVLAAGGYEDTIWFKFGEPQTLNAYQLKVGSGASFYLNLYDSSKILLSSVIPSAGSKVYYSANVSNVVYVSLSNRMASNSVLYEFDVFPAAPDAPAELQTTNITANYIELSWKSSTGAISYNIYKNDNLEGTSTTTSYTLSNLSPNTVYSIKVKTVGQSGESDGSVDLLITTPEKDSKPIKKKLITVLVSSDNRYYYDTVTNFIQEFNLTQVENQERLDNNHDIQFTIKK